MAPFDPGNPFQYAYENMLNMILRMAMHHVDRQSNAEDIAQDAFVKLLEHRRPFASEEHLKAWMIRVTLNLCKNHNRAANQRNVPLPDQVPVNPPDRSVLLAVRQLPANYRTAIYLHYFEGYTAREIASLLRRKQNTILSWLKRGRDQLRQQLIGGFDDE